MTIPTNNDKTGVTIVNKGALVALIVQMKAKGDNIYFCQNYMVKDPTLMSGGYFVSGEQLDEMIVASEKTYLTP
jgi:hypothetical protein